MKKNLISIGIIILLLVLLVVAMGFRSSMEPTPTPTVEPVASSSPLTQYSWVWLGTETHDGQFVVPATSSRPFIITFGQEGRFTLSTDCNAHSGTYATDADALTFGAIISTKMYCEGSREGQFATWLASTTSYHIDDSDMLSLVGADGLEVVFKKKEILSFEDCAAAGNLIMESYPEQCRTPDGKSFTRIIATSTATSTRGN